MEKKLNSNHLKVIAITAMTIYHMTDLIYPGFPAHPAAILLHIIWRLTAPIMWFFICEGYYHTHNIKKYMLRLFGFAIISHFAYCFAFGINFIPFTSGIFNQTSVIYPLNGSYDDMGYPICDCIISLCTQNLWYFTDVCYFGISTIEAV